MNKSDYDKYYKKGGTYVIPVEVFNELFDELDKKDNIINELEKWLNEWKNWIDRPDEFEDGIISCINDTLDKIKELKGSGK